jgi:hypothetical protein
LDFAGDTPCFDGCGDGIDRVPGSADPPPTFPMTSATAPSQ